MTELAQISAPADAKSVSERRFSEGSDRRKPHRRATEGVSS